MVCNNLILNNLRLNKKKYLFIFHDDNVSSHEERETNDYLKEENIEFMSYCPYLPELLPDDFLLFPIVKQHCFELARFYSTLKGNPRTRWIVEFN